MVKLVQEREVKKSIVLMYHNIAVPPKETTARWLYVTPRMFRFQMWYLKVAGFKVAPLSEIVAYMQGYDSDKNLVAITFDDGYQDFYDNAYPVLRAYRYPSTVFLVSDLVGKENLWDYEKVHVRKKLINWDTILNLKGEGVTFGSHSKTHSFLSILSKEDIAKEIKDSKSFLEERLQLPIEFFCYPYGDYNEEIIDMVKGSGYKGALSTKRGLVRRNDNRFEIRRLFVSNITGPFRLS